MTIRSFRVRRVFVSALTGLLALLLVSGIRSYCALAAGNASPAMTSASNEPAPSDSEKVEPQAVHAADLSKSTSKQRKMIARILAARHDHEIMQLEMVAQKAFDTPGQENVVTTSVNLLGRFHAARSISMLIQHLSYKIDPENGIDTGVISDMYPCVKALTNIGVLALPGLLDAASQSDDLQILKLSAAVVKGVLGQSLGYYYMGEQIEKTHDVNMKKRLRAVRDQMGLVNEGSNFSPLIGQ